MSDMMKFIGARLTEDEAAARAAAVSPDIWDGSGEDCPDWIVLEFAYEGLSVWNRQRHQAGGIGHETDLTRHMSRHDPARVLRQCAAIRAAVEAYHTASESPREEAVEAWLVLREDVMKPFAAVWSGHADYREEWRP